MRFYKVCSSIVLVIMSFSLFAQEENMTAEQAMALAKSKGWFDGITKEDQVAKGNKFKEELEKITGKKSREIVAETSKAYFQSLNKDHPDLAGQPQYKPDESQVQIDLDIFISLSMPDSSLKKALSIASNLGARILIQGVDKDTAGILPVLRKLKALSKNITPEPLVQLDPVKYKQYNVESVPFMVYRHEGQEYQVKGLLAANWLINQGKTKVESESFGVMGQLYPVEEINIIDLAEQRNSEIDWDKEKQKAIDRFWKIKPFVELPEAQKSSVFFIDPTITVTKDIVNLNGDIIAYKGATVNPVDRIPHSVKVIVFDATKDTHIAWALNEAKGLPQNEIVIVSTRFNRDGGWAHLEKIRKLFGREVKLLNAEMVGSFKLSSAPSIVQTENSYLRITQIGKDELSELAESTENTGEQK